jgi:hypothetical protein
VTHERRGETDEWYTPKSVFDAFGLTFDLDPCHPRDHTFTNVPARRFLYENGLEAEWGNDLVWLNQPFGNGDRAKLIWMRKFFKHRNGIALTPDRTSAKWFRELWPQAELCMFVKKIKFVRPDGTTGDFPGTGSCLWAFGQTACDALHRAVPALNGILAVPVVACLN